MLLISDDIRFSARADRRTRSVSGGGAMLINELRWVSNQMYLLIGDATLSQASPLRVNMDPI